VLTARFREVEHIDILKMNKRHENIFIEPSQTVNRLKSDVRRVASKSKMNEALIELDES
jgi:hypothetical protein